MADNRKQQPQNQDDPRRMQPDEDKKRSGTTAPGQDRDRQDQAIRDEDETESEE